MRKLTATIVLTIVMGVPAFAGEVLTPPCAPPIPGEVLTPPCTTAPGDLETPVTGDVGSPTLASSETSLSEIAANVFLNFLPLF